MQAIMQPHSRPSSAIDQWVASGEQQQQLDQTPPLTQVGFDPSVSTSSSSGHHSHEPSLEHSLAPSTSNASGLSLAVAAYQTSPRSFDFRNSTTSQPSSLRTSYSSYGTSDDALESLRRSYSTTSDIRGTLEETRLGGGGLGGVGNEHPSSEQWASNSGSFVYPTSRRESEPSTFSSRYAQAPFDQHRGSLPYPLERVDALPVRRLRRQPQPGSPGYSSSGAPSLTDGSTSPSTSRGSLVETPYLGASPILEDVATDGRYGQQVDSYPFPDMYQAAPIHRHSISGGSFYPTSVSSTPVQPIEMNRHGKRLSVSHDNIEGDRAYSPRPNSSQFGSLPMPPPYGNHTGLPDPAKSAYDYRPESARATSPRGGVYDIDDHNRQVFLPYFPPPQQAQLHQHSHSHPQPQQHLPQNQLSQLPQYPPSPSLDLLPPHDGYESLKKRRMSSIESANVLPVPSPSLGTRREAASSLHLSGLPTPASSVPFEYHHGQHSHSPAYHAYDPSSLPAYASQSQQPNVQSHPRTPTSAPALVRSGSYGLSFTSPAFLDNAPPLLLDSPVGSPRKPGPVVVGPAPGSPPTEPPCDLPQPPATSSGGGTAFMDPNYPIDNFTICHRRPPQADFEVIDRLLPRTQDLRFEEDQYTPLWVRQDGKDKEGWCALCPGNGKWLQLKNSAFWYHRQFQHGISSSSGHYFLPPLETRMAPDSSKTEGLCHMCGEYKPYQNHKGSGKGPTPWFRHAHECHQYFSPKKEARKNMKLARSLN